MSDIDPRDLDDIDREIRINELKHRVEEAAGQPLHTYESEDCPPEIAEAFWEHVAAYEEAPDSCCFVELVQAGVELPAPKELSDEAVKAKLWEVIEGLARMHVFLYNTNHFSDRELYAHLWQESLREIMRFPDFSEFGEYTSCHLDLVSSGSEEDIECWLRYYASEDTRAQWQKDFPDDVLPPRERPRYDRDRLLPRAPHDKRE